MVYLREVILHLQQELLQTDSIQTFCYWFIVDKSNLATIPINFIGTEEIISAKGYKELSVSKEEIQCILEKKPIKGLDYTKNIYKLLGISLISDSRIDIKIEEKFYSSSIKHKYLISLIFPKYFEKLYEFLKITEDNSFPHSHLIQYLCQGSTELEITMALNKLIQQENLDIIDLLILEKIQEKFISQSIKRTQYLNLSVKDTVIQILENFGDAVKKITQKRRKDHQVFEINDEYDVQDILYVILKAIFPQLKDEEPTPQVGGKFNRIDLILIGEGVMIEVKMIKAKDSDEKKFIEELKTDIPSYHRHPGLKDLFFFVYDPWNKTRNIQNFYDLNGEYSIQGVKFEIKVIIGK